MFFIDHSHNLNNNDYLFPRRQHIHPPRILRLFHPLNSPAVSRSTSPSPILLIRYLIGIYHRLR